MQVFVLLEVTGRHQIAVTVLEANTVQQIFNTRHVFVILNLRRGLPLAHESTDLGGICLAAWIEQYVPLFVLRTGVGLGMAVEGTAFELIGPAVLAQCKATKHFPLY